MADVNISLLEMYLYFIFSWYCKLMFIAISNILLQPYVSIFDFYLILQINVHCN